MFSQKIQGSAKVFAISLAIIIASLMMGLIYYVYLSQLEKVFLKDRSIAYHSLDSGVNLLLAGNQEKGTMEINQDELSWETKKWGLFQLGLAKVVSRRDTIKKAILMGHAVDEKQPNLYLTDFGKGKLGVSSNAWVNTENIKVPKGNVERDYRINKNLKHELPKKAEKSSNQLPSLEDLNFNLQMGEAKQKLEKQEVNSFFKPTLFFQLSNYEIREEIRGNIVLDVQGLCIITQQAKLSDIIIKADSVLIERGFKGSVQILSNGSVKLEEKARLEYPSCIMTNNDQARIIMEESSEMSGIIIANAPVRNSNRIYSSVFIDKKALFRGFVYNQGYTELRTKLEGYIWTNKLLYRSLAEDVYVNLLVDGEIHPLEEQTTMVVGPWLKQETRHLVKCLY